jgi:hypothetical protein
VITWVDEIWSDPAIITKDMITNSFKFTGISNDLDGSEDYFVKGYDGDPLVEDSNDIEYGSDNDSNSS